MSSPQPHVPAAADPASGSGWTTSPALQSLPAARLDELLAQGARLARWHIGATVAWRPDVRLAAQAWPDACAAMVPVLARACVQPLLLLPAAVTLQSHAPWLALAEVAVAQGVPLALDLPGCAAEEAAVHAFVHAARAAGGPPPTWTIALSRLRSPEDAERAAALRAPLRLVHGRELDPGEQRQGGREGDPAWTRAVAGQVPQLILVSHDAAYAEAVLSRLRPSATPCALEMVAELPRQRILQVARHHGVPLRMVLSAAGDGAITPLRREPRSLWWNTLNSSLDTLLPAQPPAAQADDPQRPRMRR